MQTADTASVIRQRETQPISINGITVKSDSAACLLVRVKNGKLEVSVSNPYAKKTNIKLCVTYNGEEHNLSYDLPGYDKDNYNYGGKTVTKEIDL